MIAISATSTGLKRLRDYISQEILLKYDNEPPIGLLKKFTFFLWKEYIVFLHKGDLTFASEIKNIFYEVADVYYERHKNILQKIRKRKTA